MRFRIAQALGSVAAAFIAVAMFSSAGSAQAPAAPPALTGKVSSQAEGAMEGVLVSAQREGSANTVTVVSNTQGQYSFPRDRMEPGKYAITIRAAGYVLPAARTIDVTAAAPAQIDLNLNKATTDQLAHQLTSTDWWNSMTGTAAQKELLIKQGSTCGQCHDFGRVARSSYTADQFMSVIARMRTYAGDNSSGCGTGSTVYCDEKTLARFQQSDPKPPALEGLRWGNSDAKPLAEYLATINLSGGKETWSYSLQAMPRPTGKATNMIVTVFESPRQPSVIHDLDVDANGNVWYGDSGYSYLTKLDPKTGKFTEYAAPNTRPPVPAGINMIVGLQDIQVDPSGNVWAGVDGAGYGPKMGYFDPKTEKWALFDVPGWAFITPFHKGQTDTVWGTGRETPASPLKAYRLNFKTGKVDSFPIMVDASGKDVSGPQPINAYQMNGNVTPFCYQIDRDPQDNFICNDVYRSSIVIVDSKTGETKTYPTPTPNAYPRRGYADEQGNFFFGEWWGEKVGMFDASTKTIREFPMPVKYMTSYAAVPDKNGEIWATNLNSDRLVRINPKTGETTAYLMPVYYDARTVRIDRSAAVTTIWLPNKNMAQVIRVEIPN